MSTAETITVVFECFVSVCLGMLLPWVMKVTRELGEIKSAINAEAAANVREAGLIAKLTERIGDLEVRVGVLNSQRGHQYPEGDG